MLTKLENNKNVDIALEDKESSHDIKMKALRYNLYNANKDAKKIFDRGLLCNKIYKVISRYVQNKIGIKEVDRNKVYDLATIKSLKGINNNRKDDIEFIYYVLDEAEKQDVTCFSLCYVLIDYLNKIKTGINFLWLFQIQTSNSQLRDGIYNAINKFDWITYNLSLKHNAKNNQKVHKMLSNEEIGIFNKAMREMCEMKQAHRLQFNTVTQKNDELKAEITALQAKLISDVTNKHASRAARFETLLAQKMANIPQESSKSGEQQLAEIKEAPLRNESTSTVLIMTKIKNEDNSSVADSKMWRSNSPSLGSCGSIDDCLPDFHCSEPNLMPEVTEEAETFKLKVMNPQQPHEKIEVGNEPVVQIGFHPLTLRR